MKGACVVVKRSRGKEVSAGQLPRYRNEFELLRAIASDGVVKAYELVRHDGQIALSPPERPAATSSASRVNTGPSSTKECSVGCGMPRGSATSPASCAILFTAPFGGGSHRLRACSRASCVEPFVT